LPSGCKIKRQKDGKVRGLWKNFSASFNESDRSARSIELDGRWIDSEKAQVEEVNQIRGLEEGRVKEVHLVEYSENHD